jgi:GlcNAc-P-P-Und epimerase
LGYSEGLGFDFLVKGTVEKFSVSAVYIKKFCATTQFDATTAHSSGFKAPFSLSEGLLVPEPAEGYRTLHYEFID